MRQSLLTVIATASAMPSAIAWVLIMSEGLPIGIGVTAPVFGAALAGPAVPVALGTVVAFSPLTSSLRPRTVTLLPKALDSTFTGAPADAPDGSVEPDGAACSSSGGKIWVNIGWNFCWLR